MAEQQVIRIRMHDRPGALAQICTALATHSVDIVHLDVVSASDGMVVDDLALEGKEAGDIARAVRGFLPDVAVAPLPGGTAQPVLEFGAALMNIASAGSEEAAIAALTAGACRFLRANQAIFLKYKADTGKLEPSLAGMPVIEGASPCAARAVMAPATVATFAGTSDWAPEEFRNTLGAEFVALSPVGAAGVLLLARQGAIPFTPGELDRLAIYTQAGVALIPGIPPLPGIAASSDVLPGGATSVALPA